MFAIFEGKQREAEVAEGLFAVSIFFFIENFFTVYIENLDY